MKKCYIDWARPFHGTPASFGIMAVHENEGVHMQGASDDAPVLTRAIGHLIVKSDKEARTIITWWWKLRECRKQKLCEEICEEYTHHEDLVRDLDTLLKARGYELINLKPNTPPPPPAPPAPTARETSAELKGILAANPPADIPHGQGVVLPEDIKDLLSDDGWNKPPTGTIVE